MMATAVCSEVLGAEGSVIDVVEKTGSLLIMVLEILAGIMVLVFAGLFAYEASAVVQLMRRPAVAGRLRPRRIAETQTDDPPLRPVVPTRPQVRYPESVHVARRAITEVRAGHEPEFHTTPHCGGLSNITSEVEVSMCVMCAKRQRPFVEDEA